MKQFIIKLLFRLIDNNDTYRDIDDKKIQKWLTRQHQDMGFREYMRKRDLQLLKTLGLALTQDDYKTTCGQRLELLRLLQVVEQANKVQLKRSEQIKKRNKK